MSVGCFLVCKQYYFSYRCSCYRCLCNVKDDSSQGSGGHCAPETYAALVALPDKTKATIIAEKEDQAKLNDGLWMRALLLKSSRNKPAAVKTSLRFLHPFFQV